MRAIAKTCVSYLKAAAFSSVAVSTACVAVLAVLYAAILPATPQIQAALETPPTLSTGCWVPYSPTNYNPEQGVFPDAASIRTDLEVLRNAGFDGLITYGADGTLGTEVPRLAQETGFDGLIMGIWDPVSTEENANARAASAYNVTVGYVVGNEGLDQRYGYETLQTAMDELRADTNLPVATSEEVGDYDDPAVLSLGDWVFPNVHPYFAGIYDATEGAEWTEQRYIDFLDRTDRPVLFKEVGYPTAGDPENGMSEAIQATYYRELQQTAVLFAYFEAFDQPWKNQLSIEPHWGLFRDDRTPKEVVASVCGGAGRPKTFVPAVLQE